MKTYEANINDNSYYVPQFKWDNTNLWEGSPIGFDQLCLNQGEDAKKIIVLNGFQFGDYDNSCFIERSNYQVLLKEFGDYLVEIGGDFGSAALGIWVDTLIPEELQETIDTIADYPVVDYEHYSAMKMEAINESWIDFGFSDLVDRVNEEYEVEINPNQFPDDFQIEIYHNLSQNYEFAIVESGAQIYFPIDDIDYDKLNIIYDKLACVSNEDKMELLIPDSAGIYTPKEFVEDFSDKWSGIGSFDKQTCLNPDHELYWECWDAILRNAEIDINGHRWYLYQDGDLWACREDYIHND